MTPLPAKHAANVPTIRSVHKTASAMMMLPVQPALLRRSACPALVMTQTVPVAHAIQNKSVSPTHALMPTIHAQIVLTHKYVYQETVMMPMTHAPSVPTHKCVYLETVMMQTVPAAHACPISSVLTTYVRIRQKAMAMKAPVIMKITKIPMLVRPNVLLVPDASKANVNLVRQSAVAHAATMTKSATK